MSAFRTILAAGASALAMASQAAAQPPAPVFRMTVADGGGVGAVTFGDSAGAVTMSIGLDNTATDLSVAVADDDSFLGAVGATGVLDLRNCHDCSVELSPSLTLGDEATICTWVKADDHTSASDHAYLAHGNTLTHLQARGGQTNRPFRFVANTPNLSVNFDNNPALAGWHHICVTMHKDGARSLIVDGAETDTGTAGATASLIVDRFYGLFIAGSPDFAANTMQTRVADGVAWNQILTPAEAALARSEAICGFGNACHASGGTLDDACACTCPAAGFTSAGASSPCVDTEAPGVVETTSLPATITVANSDPVDLVLTFSDNVALDDSTFDDAGVLTVNDARIEVAYKEHAGDVVTFTVQASASGHKWTETETDATPYVVSLAENKIFDTAGNPVPATSFTAFTVTIDQTPPAYVADNEPRVASSTADSVTVRARSNEAGKITCCAWEASETSRDADAIRGATDGAQGCKEESVLVDTDVDVVLDGLTAPTATLFDVWCLLEDDAPAALANDAAPFEIPNVLVGACAAGVAPQFDVAGSTITAGDDLLLKWRVSGGYETYKFAFVGAEGDAACSMQSLQAGASPLDEDPEWAFAVDGASCDDDWTFTRNLANTLDACNFAKLEDDPDFTEFRATVEVTTVEDTGAEVFGQGVKQTRTTATEFGVLVPKSVSVTSDNVQAFPGFAGLEADGRTFAVISTQAYDVDDEEFTLRLITAVAWPYVLELDDVAPFVRKAGTDNDWVLGASNKGGNCDDGAAVDNVCVQQWDLTLDRGTTSCETDGEYEVQFDVRCSNAFGNGDGCETHENPTASVTVPLQSDSVCARVVEVATVTPTLVTSTTQGGVQATDFVLQTTLYGRVSVAAEGGIATSSVVLTDLEIDSTCTSCVGVDGDKRNPFSDSSPLPSTYSWSTTPGVTFADFEFQLNADSVPFDTGAGQASITMTATVAVTYDEAGDQRTETRRVRMQAGGGETVSARASANFGVGPQGSASSTAGGSAVGTVAMAGVGVGLVAIVAAVVALVVRRGNARKAAADRKLRAAKTSSSSTSALASADVALDVVPAQTAPQQSLADVQRAYDTIQ